MGKFLIVLIVLLVVVALAQIARVHELTSELRKRREEDIPDADNRLNAKMWIAFMVSLYAFFIWLIVEYKDQVVLFQLPASEHGVAIDNLYMFNWIIVLMVFFLVNSMLFIFAAKYYRKKGVKAVYFPHDNKLELLWTIVPTIVLAVIIIYGLTIWNRITDEPSEDALTIELYSKQFDWTARYPGPDGKLGASDYRLISGTNPLGLITKNTITEKLAELADEIVVLNETIKTAVVPKSQMNEMEEKVGRLSRQRANIFKLLEAPYDSLLNFADDDILVKGEFYLPKGREINFLFRSQDVIHSAYMPHLRAQMNTVPGMTTSFKLTPTVTTDEMKTELNNPDFNYILMCNKVCGAAHYNMQMAIIVEEQAGFDQWLAGQKPFYQIEDIEDVRELEETQEPAEKIAETQNQ
jgi:cytochrome c oxidase subunit 2